MRHSARLANILLVISITIIFILTIGTVLLLNGGEKIETFSPTLSAIVAVLVVVLSAFFQNALTRQRDDDLRERERIAEAVELYFWLGYAEHEMRFVQSILENLQQNRAAQSDTIKLEQLREALTAKFMEELRDRAKISSRLPSAIAAPITDALYKTYSTSDRIYMLRGVTRDFSLGAKQIEQYLFVSNSRVKDLHDAQKMLEAHLLEKDALAVETL